MRPSSARANEQLDLRQQLANTPPPQSTTPGLHPVRIHPMAPPEWTSDCSLLLIYLPRKDETLSWPRWLTCSGQFTNITGKVRRPKTNVLPLCHATNRSVLLQLLVIITILLFTCYAPWVCTVGGTKEITVLYCTVLETNLHWEFPQIQRE